MQPTSRDLLPELVFKTSRSGGKGGQNVNKVSTKVEIGFDPANSQILTEEQKALLLEKWQNKLTNDGILQIVSQSERTQLGNKRQVLLKLDVLLEQAFKVLAKRKKTKVPKAVIEKRLLAKKRNSELKKSRGERY
jgi:ribosome-associated protein